jgi:hypothetical protein
MSFTTVSFLFHLYILFYDSKILHNSSLIFQLGVNLVVIFVILKPRLNQMYDIAHHIPSRLLARHAATISRSYAAWNLENEILANDGIYMIVQKTRSSERTKSTTSLTLFNNTLSVVLFNYSRL